MNDYLTPAGEREPRLSDAEAKFIAGLIEAGEPIPYDPGVFLYADWERLKIMAGEDVPA